MPPIKRIAVIGTGPSGAIAVDALVQERAFDVIRVFERQEKAGGNWYVNLTPEASPHTLKTMRCGVNIKHPYVPSANSIPGSHEKMNDPTP
jgi:cation diffusion facilitator CzcD-associated flavoprotein CzcO